MSRLAWKPALAIAASALLLPAVARAEPAWYEGFEGPEPSWQFEGGDVRFEIRVHDRVQGVACTGQGCERLRISGTPGTKVFLRHDAGRPRLIDELRPTLQVKSDRAGLQLFARVVLPRSIDPRTGNALRTVISGSSYTRVGRWQQLSIEQMPDKLARQVRALRAELRTHVDPREAYIEHILLNAYGGPGVTNCWIDDMDLAGFVASGGQWPLVEGANPAQTPDANWMPATPVSSSRGPTVSSPPDPGRVMLNGSIVLADGRPIFPRAVRYRGESLRLLAEMGFNTVWLPEPATAAMLAEAKQLGLWLVCPPPFPMQPDTRDGLSPTPTPIASQYEVVLAWDLGHGLTSREVTATRRWAEQVRAADRVGGRPLVCRPENDLRTYSRQADVLLLGRPVSATSLELSDYGTWLRQRPRLARPGTPIWSTIQTQPAAALMEQWTGVAAGQPLPTAFSSEQIRLVTYTAITSGSRGVLFESHTPLDAPDPHTRRRAMVLELLNLELALAEPWLAAGTYVETVASSEPEVLAAVLRTDRARLLVPIWSAPDAQFVAGQAAGNRVSFIVPGVPEEYRPYLLTAGGMEPLRRSRETGGIRVTLDEFGLTALVLLTQDPLVVNSLTRRAGQIARRAAELRRNLAAAKLQTVQSVHGRLSGGGSPSSQADAWLAAAKRSIEWCDGLLAARDYPAAYLQAERSMRPLRLLERAAWQTSTGALHSVVASPAAVTFPSLPWHRTVTARGASAGLAPNALAGGDFEELDRMLRAGWSNVQPPSTQVEASAELTSGAARNGQLGLRLAARPAQPEASETVVETPPIWITTPPLPLEAGQMVVIRGWVQVPGPIAGSVDGLLIIDSLTGEALAARVHETAGWQEFVLYRVVPRRGPMTVTFALAGLGEAWLDDVTVQALPPTGTGSMAGQAPTRLPLTGNSGWR